MSMIVEGNDYTVDYFKLIGGFQCKITGRNHTDRGEGRGVTQEQAFDSAFIDFRACREAREDIFIGERRKRSAT